MPSFCRHNRFVQNCPICREPEAPKTRARSAGSGRTRTPGGSPSRSSSAGTGSSRSAPSRGVRVRQLARAAEDGYRSELVPGLKASADAERLADELAFASARLRELAVDPPGLWAEVSAESDREEALWLLFLVAWLSPLEGEDPWAAVEAARVPWASGELPRVSPETPRGPRAAAGPGSARGRLGVSRLVTGPTPVEPARTVEAYRAWTARAGSQEAALLGDASWTPERRFDRDFERLALPGLGRAQRFDLLVAAGRLGLADVHVFALHPSDDDPGSMAAKRVFGIGERFVLERRAADLADEADVPLEALELALFNWGQPLDARATLGSRAQAEPEERERIARALGV